MNIHTLILAAGKGTRMQVSIPKPLVPYQGKPLIGHVIEAVRASGLSHSPTVIISADQAGVLIKDTLKNYPLVSYIEQAEQLGTGHAVQASEPHLKEVADNILVLYGDQPLISSTTMRELASTHLATGADLTFATVKLSDFTDWRAGFFDFGRIVRDANGEIVKNVEKKDATEDELAIREVNPSLYCFKASWLWENLANIKNKNSQREYYLTDLIGIAVAGKARLANISMEPKEALGVNTREQLASIEALATKTQKAAENKKEKKIRTEAEA